MKQLYQYISEGTGVAPKLAKSIRETFGNRIELITVNGRLPYWCVYINDPISKEELIQLDSLIKAVCPEYTGWAAKDPDDKVKEIQKELQGGYTYEYIRIDKKWFKK